MKKRIFLLMLLFVSTITFGQTCDCSANFKWLKKTFEENDAGYQYVIDEKGIEAYKSFSEEYIKKAKQVNTVAACATLMKNWTKFFRKSHLSIVAKVATKTNNSSNTNSERVTFNTKAIEKELIKNNQNGFEGIWLKSSYKVGVKKIDDQYIGFVIETGKSNWKKGEVKFKLLKENNHFKSKYYTDNHSSLFFNDVELVDDNTLKMGGVYFYRLLQSSDTDRKFNKFVYSPKPYLDRINSKTLILRIPTFNSYAKKDIDQLILANKSEILKTENLIIDIRNNGGGSDSSYREILPFLYTNPIKTIGVEFRSTKLNNQRMLDFINLDKYHFSESGKKWAKKSFDILSAKLGEFVNLSSSGKKFSVRKLDTVYAYPKNIGIIINQSNGSTSEQFLLAAKQSKKVKLFGTTTFGVLDISNMYFVDFPSKQFTLGYSLSKSMRIPDMTIDGKGIQPDYYIDKSISNKEWVNYVAKILEQ